MKLPLTFSCSIFICYKTLIAQDTIKIQRDERYDKNCFLEICIKDECFTDSVPKKLFIEINNIELKMNESCTTNKNFDVFVSSFEISTITSGKNQHSNAQSSFFTDPQKRLIQKTKQNDTFTLKNITIHAPDGFKKMSDFKIVVN